MGCYEELFLWILATCLTHSPAFSRFQQNSGPFLASLYREIVWVYSESRRCNLLQIGYPCQPQTASAMYSSASLLVFKMGTKTLANEAHLKILRQGVDIWNDWYAHNPDTRPDFSKADLSKVDLYEADLFNAVLRGANLSGADISYAFLAGADLRGANLKDAALQNADLRLADLTDATLSGADLFNADLRGANVIRVDLRCANLNSANLAGAMLCRTRLPEDMALDADRDCRVLGIDPNTGTALEQSPH